MNTSMFIIGFIIFVGYLYGLLKAIIWGHTSQRDDMEKDPEMIKYYRELTELTDDVDYDGMGNQGRVPVVKKKVYKKKKKT